MVATISEPMLKRADAAMPIEQKLRQLYSSTLSQRSPVKRATLADLHVVFQQTRVGLCFGVYRAGERMLGGLIDPTGRRRKPPFSASFEPSRWVRGRWEESFGVPFRSYDPHWSDEVPPILRKAIRKAASSPPGPDTARTVVELMTSYADGNSEDVIEFAVDGNPDAAIYAGWVINAMRGPNMAAMVPLMMWGAGVDSSDVLNAYVEAHDKMGVRRKHLREILGASKPVADFVAYATGLDRLERMVRSLRAMPSTEAMKQIARLPKDPLIDRMFPSGLAAFLAQYVQNPNLKFRLRLSRKGLFG